ncbi:MAG TPA: hypothetical protein VHO67_16415 [Polyangia bacterium]|nr:hypothetical protein [Polyangia bacterium]
MKAFTTAATLLVCARLIPSAAHASGAAPGSQESYRFVLGAGAAAEMESLTAGHFGAAAFVEVEAIDEWLELELGAQILATAPGREASLDLVLKKPFRVTERLEVMTGLGPTVIQTSGAGETRTAWGIEAAVDFMYWPAGRVGFWAEPAYEIVLSGGLATVVSCTVGPMLRF